MVIKRTDAAELAAEDFSDVTTEEEVLDGHVSFGYSD